MRPLLLPALFLTAMSGAVPQVIAQAPPGVPVAGEEETPEPERPRETHPTLQGSSGLGGFGAMAPGQWGLVQSQLRNPLDTEQQMRLVFTFSDFAQRQFVRIASLPPRSTRSVELPARAGRLPENAKAIPTEILLFPVDKDLEMGRAEGSALVWQGKLTFAVIGDSGGEASEQERIGRIDEEADDVLTAVRRQAGQEQERQQQDKGDADAAPDDEEAQKARRRDSAKLYPTVSTTPRFDIAWDVAYLTAITADKPNFDAAQRRALRRWIARGGVLVVFLDQVDNERMGEIIGQAWTIEEVDRLSLTHVAFQDVPGGDTKESFELGATEPFVAKMATEDPIAFTRVIAPDWNRHLDVNNWPALLSKRLGRGMLVAITVGGRAWTVEETRTPDKKQVLDPGTLKALDRLTNLLMPIQAQSLVRADPTVVLMQDPGRAFLTQLIGYEVLKRKWVALVMLAYFAAFLAGGLYWHRRGHGERLGIAALVLSVGASVALVVMGMKQRGQVEPSAASLQLAQVQPGLSSVHVSGPASLYHPERTDVKLTGKAGGWIWPVEVSEEGDLQRMRTDDLDQWSWTNLQLSAGVPRPLDVSVDVEVSRPFTSDLRYTDKGLAGTLRWPMEEMGQDLLIATPQANLAPSSVVEDGELKIAVAPESVLPGGVFSGAQILNENQKTRSELLGSVFRVSRFDGPTLLGWTGGLNLSDEITPTLARQSSALWAVPLQVEPSHPGDRVTIPWPLIPMQNVRLNSSQEQYGFPTMPLYQPQGRLDDTDNDQKPDTFTYWINGNNPSGFIGRFLIPPQVLPLKIESATVHLNLQAIGRPVRILAIDADKAVELATLDGPDGPTAVPIDAEKLKHLSIDAGGGVLLAFDVQATPGSDSQRPTGLDMWQVRYFGLEVSGVVENKD